MAPRRNGKAWIAAAQRLGKDRPMQSPPAYPFLSPQPAPVATPSVSRFDLLGLLYQGAVSATPWQAFAEALRVAMGARNVMITLHHVGDQGRDSYVMASIRDDTIDWAAVEVQYRRDYMSDDPLRPDLMVPGQMATRDDVPISESPPEFLKQLGLSHCLRTCVAEPGGMRCWVDVVRGREHAQARFSATELALLQDLTPHLGHALELFARLKSQETERAVYESMVEHFGLGCMLISDAGELVHINRVAQDIVQSWPGVTLQGGWLRLQDQIAQCAVDDALRKVLAAHRRGDSEQAGELVRLGELGGRLLGLLVYPAPLQAYYRSGQAPSAIVYLTDLSAGIAAVKPGQKELLGRIGRLFDLTRQEARLALLLAYGHNLAEAACEMCIAENAARNYSKKIYAKMGIGGQTDLVRLMLRSLSFLS